MSIHINAKEGDIEKTVLLPGDPSRAKWIADTFLKDAICYNTTRGMLGYTGVAPNGKRISVQGSGMGQPSLSIYVNELIDSYGVERIIRVGSAGALQKELKVRDIVLVMASCTDSGMNRGRFSEGVTYAPVADFNLLMEAYNLAEKMGIKVRVGNNHASDYFYGSDNWKQLVEYGVLTIEMESAELYTLGAQKGVQTLSILTISNNLITKKELSSDDREKSFFDMMKLALEV